MAWKPFNFFKYNFIAIYLYVRDVNAMTIRELQSHKIGDFAF